MDRFEEPVEPLSAEGQARKASILAELQESVTLRRRVRRASISMAAALPILVWALWPSRVTPPVSGPPLPRPVYAFTQVLRTDPSTLSRLSATSSGSMAEIVRRPCSLQAFLIDDRTLSRMLAETGKPPEVFRMGNRVILAMDLQTP